ncbi:hypothetical protein CYMTET_14790 [Cymbomonas tetramitiformis]|uniref:Uncharacterized protein n=1 Tax=Cymbomonas tetramitiformis TaxID=36881 RepID=A0AAE0L9Z9_9CHLO|nr:hypothetical protein CYMTET_14790 [Cymbomonas tetramitiformis]|eukprot:gene5432-6587_t
MADTPEEISERLKELIAKRDELVGSEQKKARKKLNQRISALEAKLAEKRDNSAMEEAQKDNTEARHASHDNKGPSVAVWDGRLTSDVGPDADKILRVELNQRLKQNLKVFWETHGIDFALFWLMLPPEKMKALLHELCPDIRDQPVQPGEAIKPTDDLIPEINTSLLMAQQGRALVAVCQTRALEDVDEADLALVRKLDEAGRMPIFSGMEVHGTQGDAFEGKLAFVVPDGRIVSCRAHSAEAEENKRLCATGVVIDANQYITKNVRQTLLLQFICGIADYYLQAVTPQKQRHKQKGAGPAPWLDTAKHPREDTEVERSGRISRC